MSKVIGSFIRKSIAGFVALVLCTVATGLAAQNVQLREDRPDSYVVVRGDTLWDISGVFLQNPAAWPQIWRVNPQIENPDLIYPGDIVALRYINGQPVLELQRGAGVGDPVIRLSPGIRFGPLTGGIGEISFEDISSLLSRNIVADPDGLDDYGYMIGTRARNLMAVNNEVVFARGDWEPTITSYAFVRPRRTLTRPDTGEVIGVELDHIAEGRVMELDDETDVSTIRITYVEKEVRVNDKVIQQDRTPIQSTYIPTSPEFNVDEFVLGFTNGNDYGGTGDTIIMSGGSDTGLEIGNVLAVRRADKDLKDEVRGDVVTVKGEEYGTVMIYRVFKRASLALVLHSGGVMNVDDRISDD